MAISRCFETTKERLDKIFETKMIDPDLSKQYFRGMHPYTELKTSRTDVIAGCIKFINESAKESSIDTYNFHIDISGTECIINCITRKYAFPKISIINYKSQFIILEFVQDDKTKRFKYEEYQICNYAMIGLAEALAKLYKECYNGDRNISL